MEFMRCSNLKADCEFRKNIKKQAKKLFVAEKKTMLIKTKNKQKYN